MARQSAGEGSSSTRRARRTPARQRQLPHGTAITFLLSDVQDSVHLWEEGAAEMRRALARHDRVIERAAKRYGGVVVRPRGEGDSRFVVFGRASSGVFAALDIQRQFLQEAWSTSVPLRVRMALHTGRAEPRRGDYYGNDVNRCARLRSLAHGGQVLLSEVTARVVESELPADATLQNLGLYRLRGLTEPERVFQLNYSALAGEFPP